MLSDDLEGRMVGLGRVLRRYPSVGQSPRELEHPTSEGAHVYGWMMVLRRCDLHECLRERVVLTLKTRRSPRAGPPQKPHDSDGLFELLHKVVHLHAKSGEVHRLARAQP